MDITQIIESLKTIFNEKKHRIVFWNDPEREFESEIDSLKLEGIELVHLEQVGHFALKIRIEISETQQKFLLYSTSKESDPDEDFLLDIRSFAYKFRADRSTIILNELNLSNQQLNSYLKSRQKFFDSKDRLDNLKKIITPNDNNSDIDRKMLAVTTKSGQHDFYNIARAVFQSYLIQNDINFETPSETWKLIEKFSLSETFWKLSEQIFSFKDDNPTPEKLLIQLFVSDFVHCLNDSVPQPLVNLRLSVAGEHNAVTFFAQWRDSTSHAGHYNKLADYIAQKLNIVDIITRLPLEQLLETVTFSQIDDQILQELFKRFNLSKNNSHTEYFRNISEQRQQEHWIRSQSVHENERNERHSCYEIIALAAEIFGRIRQYSNGDFQCDFHCDTASEIFHLYTKELYKIDQLYRRFHINAAHIHADHAYSDQMKSLCNEVDNIYCNKYISSLELKCNRFLENGLLANWKIENIPNQYQFYEQYVAKESVKHRVFVIISDAFRYAAAEELKRTLNGCDGFLADIGAMLGVVPSYTALGMAALLPHNKLMYNNNGDILADGHSTTGIENRNSILSHVHGLAVHADAMLSMKRDEVRKLIDNVRVVYIYHNVIDSHGDHLITENETFQATGTAIDELTKMIQYISNTLSGRCIFVTSDHGFVYTESPPTEINKSHIVPEQNKNIIKTKKRYYLGHHLEQNHFVWYGNTEQTAQCPNMEFGIAKGYNLFNFRGASRFFHGGAMPQEIIIPVVTVTTSRNKNMMEQTKTKTVSIALLDNRIKITTPKHRLQFVQTEPVSDRIKPVTVKIAIYDINNQPVSNIETLTFSNMSTDLSERQQSVYLSLQSRPYDKSEQYRLVLRDADSNIELLTHEVIIDRVIADDFE
ncbi:MAG: BREX-1 system phosphatase PglZ type A [Planctomycetaceae bacterium]|jgi:uncharacterized protein (TIGR02687 family)|nr:BREX-1 system phosphatase PglZ type A [Planctomycetaceae bacterium]